VLTLRDAGGKLAQRFDDAWDGWVTAWHRLLRGGTPLRIVTPTTPRGGRGRRFYVVERGVTVDTPGRGIVVSIRNPHAVWAQLRRRRDDTGWEMREGDTRSSAGWTPVVVSIDEP